VESTVQEAQVAVILGTDHFSQGRLLTLTRQNYSTPYGVLPTEQRIVDGLAAAIGSEAAFAGELNHRTEHSIELAAVWLHHMRGGRPCHLVPILCGSYGQFVQGSADLNADPALESFVTHLREELRGRQAVVIAAGDLSHVGPAFDGEPVDAAGCARLRLADEKALAQVCAGSADGFFSNVQQIGDRNNVCGLPPIHLALRLLEPVSGEEVAYDRCPADEHETSFVSIAGVILR
jgi:AmmeMemoRadiSam system protein B